ncbi:MAG: sulfotransferase domain-containing protein [Pirellulales bacterium]
MHRESKSNAVLAALNQLLSSKNGVVRKAAIAALRAPRWWKGQRARPDDYRRFPPVLANSFPKSGTHLVFQIVDGLPNATNYGAFLASMTSSFQFRERSAGNIRRFIRGIVPGEIIRGHLYYDPQNAAGLARKNVVHYFAYRDPRDVVVSEAHYLREMNRWHRLHRHFASLPSMEDAISLSITGFDPPIAGIEYPNIGARFGRYRGWLESDDCLPIRFEELMSAARAAIVHKMAQFYARHCETPINVEACAAQMAARILPQKSHTFRSGKKAGWAGEFTAEHRRLFDRVAGQLLIDLGYEPNHAWAALAAATSR